MTRNPINAIVAMMEMGPDPISNMSQDSIGQIEVGMAVMPGDDCGDCDDYGNKFRPDDYVLARQLVAQVGDVERVKELLDNLDEAYEALDINPVDMADEDEIALIAGHIPDEIDHPTYR